MSREPPIRAHGVVIEPLSARHCRARLPNGKEVIAHLGKTANVPLETDSCLLLELTPFDFDHARIAGPGADPPDPPDAPSSGLANSGAP